MRRGAALGAVLCAALALGACSEETPLTEIVLAIDSDIPEITRVSIELENFGDGEPIDVTIGGLSDYPKSLSLVHDGGPLGPIHLTVTGYGEDDVALITEPRRAIRFEKDETLLLRVELLKACVEEMCGDAMPACIVDEDGNAKCVSAKDATDETLTKWNGSLDGPDAVDSGVPGDGGAAMDGGADGSMVVPPDGGGDTGMTMADSGDPDKPNGAFPYTPSNFLPADETIDGLERRDVAIGCGAVVYNSDNDTFDPNCGVDPLPVIYPMTQGDGSNAKLLVFKDLTVAAGSSLTIVGSQPVILAVFGMAEIAGSIDASAVGSQPGPSGNTACTVGVGQVGADGPGGSTIGNIDAAEGGGGGAFGSAGALGGEGGDSVPEQGLGGAVEGTANLAPLRGGCPGGAGGNSRSDDPGGAGGGGGGALQISVAGALTISGSLSAVGGAGAGGGGQEAGGGGGGSGGALLVEADSLSIETTATFAVNGGGGGAGHDDGNNSDPALPGSDGSRTTSAPAAGGVGAGGASSGGDGAALTAPAAAGAKGIARQSVTPLVQVPGAGAGGGGGGVGRIRIRGAATCLTPPGLYSPGPAVDCVDCSCGAPPDAYSCTRAGTDTHGYFVCAAALGWDAARASCVAAGMNLAHVDDGAENTLVDGASTGHADVWLGGNDPSENIWRWTDDGTQFWSGDSAGTATEGDGSSCTQGAAGCSFSAWGTNGSNQPDNADPVSGEGDCLSLVPGDGWYDANCATAKPYVCEGL